MRSLLILKGMPFSKIILFGTRCWAGDWRDRGFQSSFRRMALARSKLDSAMDPHSFGHYCGQKWHVSYRFIFDLKTWRRFIFLHCAILSILSFFKAIPLQVDKFTQAHPLIPLDNGQHPPPPHRFLSDNYLHQVLLCQRRFRHCNIAFYLMVILMFKIIYSVKLPLVNAHFGGHQPP